MTITYDHNIGDITEVKPYSIFKNPTPVEWNEDSNGYGEYWYPGDELTVMDQFDLYAQYDPIYITYYLTSYVDGQFETQHVAYANRVGTRIEVADFPGISNFSTWVDSAGEPVSVGSFIYLTSDVDLYMSCDTSYTMSFNGNGHPDIKLSSVQAVQHTYVDHRTGDCVNVPATVVLPQIDCQLGEVIAKAWQINWREIAFGSLYTLTADTAALLVWKDAIKYTLKFGCRLMNMTYAFRYLILKTDSTNNSGRSIRLSELKFVSADKKSCFMPPSQFSYKTHNVKSYVKSSPSVILDGNAATDFVFEAANLPCGIEFDFKSSVLNISKYSVCQLFAASDIEQHRGETPKDFQVYVSNDKQTWFLAAKNTNQLDAGNSALAYEQAIRVSSTGEKLDFGPSSPVNQDVLVEYAKGNGGYINTGYKPTQQTVIEFEMCTFGQYTDTSYIGVDQSLVGNGPNFRFWMQSDSLCEFQAFGAKWRNELGDSLKFKLSDWRIVKCSLKHGITFGADVQQALPNMPAIAAQATQTDVSICLFGGKSLQVNIGLKYFKIYETSSAGQLQLKMYLLPAIDKDRRPCMIDQATNKKFYSANSADIACYS